MKKSYNQQQLNGQQLTIAEKIAIFRTEREEQEKKAKKILSKPKRRSTNKNRK